MKVEYRVESGIKCIDISTEFEPPSWKRPGQSGRMRFDTQAQDKSVFAMEVYSGLQKSVEIKNGQPIFPEGDEVSVSLVFKTRSHKKDIDNMAKYVLDALQSYMLKGVVYHDDRQVAMLIASKIVTKRDVGTNIQIRSMRNEK